MITVFKLIFKANGKKVILECFFITSILIVSFFSFTIFMDRYAVEWNDLIETSNSPDFEVYVDLNGSLFLSEYTEFNQHFDYMKHKLFSYLPEDLIRLSIHNETVNPVSFFIINNLQDSTSSYKIEDNTGILIVKNSTLPNITDVQINWNINTSLEFFNISHIIGNSYFTDIFGTNKNYNIAKKINMYNIIIKDTDFFNFIDDIGFNSMRNELISERILLYSLFSMNKTSYYNLLPNKLKRDYTYYIQNIKSEFFLFYYQKLETEEYHSDFDLNDIFIFNLEISIQKISSVLYNSLIFASMIVIFLLGILYEIFLHNRKSLLTTMSVISSRGVKFKEIRKHTFLSQLIITGFALILTFNITSLYLVVQHYYSYRVFQLILLISQLSVSVSLVFIIQKTNGVLREEKRFSEYESEKKLSRSELLNIAIQVSMIIIIFIIFASFWALNSFLLRTAQLSVSTIWLLSIGVILIIALLIVIPKTQIIILSWFLRNTIKLLSSASNTIVKTLISISKKRKRILTICFYMMVFTSLLMISFTSIQKQQFDITKSSRIYDYSLITNTETSYLISNICGYNNCLVSYIDQVFTFDGIIDVIYINNPLKFYYNSYFSAVRFEKHTSEEVFAQLNSSTSIVISSNTFAEHKQYLISENISIPRTQSDRSIKYDFNILYDCAYYLPFYSDNNQNWFLKKYDESLNNSTSFQYAITSIKRQNNNIEEVLNYLNLNGIWYVVKHDDSNINLSDNFSNNLILSQLKNLTVILDIIIPIFLTTLLMPFLFDTNKNFKYLTIRGLKNRIIRKSQGIWLTSFLFLVFIFSLIVTSVILGLAFYIHNSTYGFPITFVFSWMYIIPFILPIILILIYIYSIYPIIVVGKKGRERTSNLVIRSETNE